MSSLSLAVLALATWDMNSLDWTTRSANSCVLLITSTGMPPSGSCYVPNITVEGTKLEQCSLLVLQLGLIGCVCVSWICVARARDVPAL